MTNFNWPIELRFDPPKKCLSPPELHCKKRLVFDWYWTGQILSNSASEIASICSRFPTIEYWAASNNYYKTWHSCSWVLEIINVKCWTQQIQILVFPSELNLTSHLSQFSVSRVSLSFRRQPLLCLWLFFFFFSKLQPPLVHLHYPRDWFYTIKSKP